MANRLFRWANLLYRHAFPLYLPLYAAYKAWSDRAARAQLRRLVGNGMTVLDVGANVGVYTRLLSRAVGPGGTVIAFEPSGENHRRLLQLTRGLGNVTVVRAAVGEATGTAQLYVSKDLNVDHRTYDAGTGSEVQEVDIVRLDDRIAPGTRIDFMKIDVQGYELQVLRGALRVLRENPQLRLFMEFWPHGLRQAGTGPRELLDFLHRLDLSACRIDGSPFAPGELERLAFRADDGYFDCLVGRADASSGKDRPC